MAQTIQELDNEIEMLEKDIEIIKLKEQLSVKQRSAKVQRMERAIQQTPKIKIGQFQLHNAFFEELQSKAGKLIYNGLLHGQSFRTAIKHFDVRDAMFLNPATVGKPNRRKIRPILAWFQGSEAQPYQIKPHELYGLSCNCKGWKYHRHCKHTDQIADHLHKMMFEEWRGDD